jgi:hypothetical protein
METKKFNQKAQDSITNQPIKKSWAKPQRTKLKSSQTEALPGLGNDAFHFKS